MTMGVRRLMWPWLWVMCYSSLCCYRPCFAISADVRLWLMSDVSACCNSTWIGGGTEESDTEPHSPTRSLSCRHQWQTGGRQRSEPPTRPAHHSRAGLEVGHCHPVLHSDHVDLCLHADVNATESINQSDIFRLLLQHSDEYQRLLTTLSIISVNINLRE